MNDFIKFRFDVSDIRYWYWSKENGTLSYESEEVPYGDVSVEL